MLLILPWKVALGFSHHHQQARIRTECFSLSKDGNDVASSNTVSADDDGSSPSNRREFMKTMIVSATALAALQTIPAAVALDGTKTLDSDLVIERKDSLKRKKKAKAVDYRYFLAGGACSALSHGVATPFDVIKTKMQADPETYNSGLKDAAISLITVNGPGVLLSGLGPTIIGYGVEGAVKFGVYESLKPVFLALLHADDKFVPYLAASVGAGAIASLLLCPMERARVKAVTSGEKTGLVSVVCGSI